MLFAATAVADPGRSVDELLDLARAGNPTLRAAQREAEAARERVQPAGALPDPMLKIELMDLTNMGETSPRFSPSQVGSTQYTISQQLPLWGKRELRRGQAEALARVAGHGAEDMTLELLTLLKRGYAQYWQVVKMQALSREIAELDDPAGEACAGPLRGRARHPAGCDPRPARTEHGQAGADPARRGAPLAARDAQRPVGAPRRCAAG